MSPSLPGPPIAADAALIRNGEELPTVSVIVPCRNEELFIERCLDSILDNHFPAERLEIIVADGMSQDRTRSILARYVTDHPSITVIDNVAGTIPAAMNLGIKVSRGQIIMKVDAHSTYPPDYIGECVRYLIGAGAEMAGGIWNIAPRRETLMAKAIAVALSHRFGSGNARVKTGLTEPQWSDCAAFGCWRRETLEQLGGFDERLAGSSDMDLNNRLRSRGGKILLVPQIRVTYYADADLPSFWRHNFSDGVWTTYVIKFGKQASSWRHWVPFTFVVALGVTAAGLWLHPICAWIMTAIGAAYGLISLTVSAQLALRMQDWKYAGLLPIAFAARHLAHGLGAVYGLVLCAVPGLSWRGRRARVNAAVYSGKRLLDLTGASIGLVLASPLLIALYLLVRWDSPGPVLYRGDRLGRFGKPFQMLKFRTMKENAQGLPITVEGDQRITRVGRFLRRYKLDELPQLINVVRGEMSLVGPRPECAFYFQYYADEERRLIHSVRPGLTDYGSLRFHDEGVLIGSSPDPVKLYLEQIRHEKVREQLRYIREQSLWTDVKIIVTTIAIIIATRLRLRRDVQAVG
jgi:succinoglycan biosynthesis protein ExoA